MSRKPNVLCAGVCGRLLYGGTGVLPAGEQTCRPCRRQRSEARRSARPCAVCGSPFQPGKHRPADVVTCSTGCTNKYRCGILTVDPADALLRAQNRYRAKRRARRVLQAATWDGIADEQILDRDGWRCGICKETIDRSARWPSPQSKSIDHVVPLSRGGDDTAANKRAAHLGCNIRRGAGGGAEQLALVG